MAHANETAIRNAYAAFGRGDLEGYLKACASDFSFHVPGKNLMTGHYKAKDGFMQLAQKVMQYTGGKFEEEVVDVLANDSHGVVLAVHRFSRNGKPKTYRTAHVYNIRGGKLAECWEQPQDPRRLRRRVVVGPGRTPRSTSGPSSRASPKRRRGSRRRHGGEAVRLLVRVKKLAGIPTLFGRPSPVVSPNDILWVRPASWRCHEAGRDSTLRG